MKAKEYAERLLNAGDKELGLMRIWGDFINEITIISEQRHAKKLNAIQSIVDEQEMKWKSFCKIIKSKLGIDLKEDGFKMLLFHKSPELYMIGLR